MTTGAARILVTGARGFIGRAILHALLRDHHGLSLHALRRHGPHDSPSFAEVTWHDADLFDSRTVEEILTLIRPTHCIHTAWETTPPDYWSSPRNYLWHDKSLGLAKAFAAAGGQRFISLGSVAEYEWTSGCIKEDVTPENPSSLYGRCKRDFHRDLIDLGQTNNIAVAIARIFFVYGPFEHPTKLVASACRAVATGEPASFGPLDLWRDYIHVADLGRGIAALTTSTLTGIVNVASGEPVRQSTLISTIAALSGRPDLLHIGKRPRQNADIPVLFADTEKIRTVGWQPLIALEDGLSNTLNWWFNARRHAA